MAGVSDVLVFLAIALVVMSGIVFLLRELPNDF